MPGIHILVVDNENDWLELVSKYFSELGNYVEPAHSLAEARSSLLTKKFDVVFTNLHLQPTQPPLSSYPRYDYLGVQVIKCVHEQTPGTPCFIISGEPSELNERLRDYPEYVDFFFKPRLALDWDTLNRKISRLDTYKRLIEDGYRSVEVRVIGHKGQAGTIISQISAEPIEGIEKLITTLKNVEKLKDKIPALGVRLSVLQEMEQHRAQIGLLSDTQQYQRREAIYFAMVVCQELDVYDRIALGVP
jgi:DNA-binding NtrC family response regulator